MVDIVQLDHVTEGLAQLPSQWGDKPVVRGILEAWLTPLNESEQNLIDVRDGFNINTAVGFSLDIAGDYFDETRQGRTDDEYRSALIAIIASSNGSGTPDQLIDLFSSLTGTTDITYWRHYPLGQSLYSRGGSEVALSGINSMDKAAVAGTEYAAVMYDVNGWGWIPSDKTQVLANVITNTPDNVIMNDGAEDFNLAADVLLEETGDGQYNSSFVDSSIPAPEESGYGGGYGQGYGQGSALTSIFVEASILDNPLVVSGGNGFVLWAEDEVYDPVTLTTNKAIPIFQLQTTGIKPKQPLARQFFNWMIASIDDWFSFFDARTLAVGTVKITDDVSAVAGDYDTLYGGTWIARGSEIYTMTAGINPTETVYIFERTA